MPRALKACPTTGCPEVTTHGRCSRCRAQAEARRGSASARGYDHTHAKRFRAAVLRRDPLCVCADTTHGHGQLCLTPSAHADHHPRTKRELRALGLDEHDPAHGRGLCASCHNKHTAATTPGGWHAA
jgi:5-methylcytosine-specific restriction protein A